MIPKLWQCQNLRKATGNICACLWHLVFYLFVCLSEFVLRMSGKGGPHMNPFHLESLVRGIGMACGE